MRAGGMRAAALLCFRKERNCTLNSCSVHHQLDIDALIIHSFIQYIHRSILNAYEKIITHTHIHTYTQTHAYTGGQGQC